MNEMKFTGYTLPLGKKTYIMGIVNVTPDSFSDGGSFFKPLDALSCIEEMINDGVDIIDMGAVSTRPFSKPVTPEEEWSRLKGVFDLLPSDLGVPLSVDTFNIETARRCLDAGADIINDVSGVFSYETARLIKEYNAGWILMHGGVKTGNAETQREYPQGILFSVNEFFADCRKRSAECGIPQSSLCFDAGFGFSKSNEQNIELLNNYDKIEKGDTALLCALSRKRFIGKLSSVEESGKRDPATLCADIIACSKGADIVRVHNVKMHRQAFSLFDNLRQF